MTSSVCVVHHLRETHIDVYDLLPEENYTFYAVSLTVAGPSYANSSFVFVRTESRGLLVGHYAAMGIAVLILLAFVVIGAVTCIRCILTLLIFNFTFVFLIWHLVFSDFYSFNALTWLGIRKNLRSVKVEWWGVGVVICLDRCILFAYGLAYATASPKPHLLLLHLNPDWFYLSGTGLPRLSWKRNH